MDRETMISELEGSPEVQAPESTPASPETGIEYFLGDKSSRIPEEAEFHIKHNGQMARIPASKLINTYRQASHLESKYKDISDKYGAYEKKVGPLEEWEKRSSALAPYEQLQKWSVENPDAWQHIWDSYQKAQNGLLPQSEGQPSLQTDAFHKTISELREQLGELRSWKEERTKAEQDQALQSEMQKIEGEAQEFAKKIEKYGIKLDEQDEEGISLKGRILKFASDNGIGSFEIAAKTYLNDTLLEKALQMGRQEGVKGVKGDVSAGIVSRSGVPQRGQAPQVDVRKMSEEDRRSAALRELTSE
jgi:hypothetical protein